MTCRKRHFKRETSKEGRIAKSRSLKKKKKESAMGVLYMTSQFFFHPHESEWPMIALRTERSSARLLVVCSKVTGIGKLLLV